MTTYLTSQIAKLVKRLTYDEMIEISRRFSEWTEIEEDGSSREALISPDQMAANISDWAQGVIEEE